MYGSQAKRNPVVAEPNSINMRPLMRPMHQLNAQMRANPLKTSIGVTTVKAGMADVFVQKRIENRTQLDCTRTATFTIFGCVYQGCFQYFMFNIWFERIWPGVSVGATVRKILAVNAVGDPVFFFPTFYTLKEAMASPVQEVTSCPAAVVTRALGRYRDNCFDDWRNSWSVWLPGHAITYGVCPLHLRMPWVASLSFGYLCLLSFTRGAM